MWYVKEPLIRRASSLDELWRNLHETGVAGNMGLGDKGQLYDWVSDSNPEGLSNFTEEVKGIPEEATRRQLEKVYSNYVSGKVLGEEIRRAQEIAQAEGREASTSELRAARMRANERIQQMRVSDTSPTFQVGTRGPLGQPRLIQPKPEFITNQTVIDQASEALQKSIAQLRQRALGEVATGTRKTPELTASDTRMAIQETNEYLASLGLPEAAEWVVGKRGPTGIPRLVRGRDRAKSEYDERLERRERKQNLDLEPVMDIEEGQVPIPVPHVDPTDDNLPEEAVIENREADQFEMNVRKKNLQASYQPRPKMHDHCRCVVLDLGSAYVWRTSGDERVCPDCKQHSDIFNGLGQV